MPKLKDRGKLNIFGYQTPMGSTGNKTQERETPRHIYDHLDREYHFTRDVCASDKNFKHKKYWTKKDNCLNKKWSGICFMNPPYNQLQEFMRKAYAERHNAITVCFIPIMTNVGWFHEFVVKGEVYFVKGRPKFDGARTGFPQPMAVVVFGKEEGKFGTIEFKEYKNCNKCGAEFIADKKSINRCIKCVTRTCLCCGKEYILRVSSKSLKMCDDCRNSKRVCKCCGGKIKKTSLKNGALYCSKYCSSKWFLENKRKATWKEQRLYLVAKLGNKCEICGNTEKANLRIRSGDPLRPHMYRNFIEGENWRKLGLVCQSCHSYGRTLPNQTKKILGIFRKVR